MGEQIHPPPNALHLIALLQESSEHWECCRICAAGLDKSKKPKEQCRTLSPTGKLRVKSCCNSCLLTGGTDFPRQRGLAELGLSSEISPQTLQIYQVSSVQAKVAGKGPGLYSKFSALLIGRGIYCRSGSWAKTAEAAKTKVSIPDPQIKQMASFSLIITSARGKRNSLR